MPSARAQSSPGGAGRYAPSPSGDLHLGNLRTALIAWLAARSTNRRFLLRVENLDRDRDKGCAERQLTDLRRIGIDWVGEAALQTELADAHERAIHRLAERELVYECTCSRKDILAAASAPHAPQGAYPGTCRDKSERVLAREREAIAPRRPALRLRAPEPGAIVTFGDLVQGSVSASVDDFVLRRGDGTVAYNLAVVVDDAEAGVDQVVRGADLALGTPRQMLLQRLLGYQTPEYAHVPLVLGQSGKRLAKRDGAVTLAELEARGISAEQVRQALLDSLGSVSELEPTECKAAAFFAQLPKSEYIFDGDAPTLLRPAV